MNINPGQATEVACWGKEVIDVYYSKIDTTI